MTVSIIFSESYVLGKLLKKTGVVTMVLLKTQPS